MDAHELHRVGYFNNYCPEPEKVYNIQSTFLFALTGVRTCVMLLLVFVKKWVLLGQYIRNFFVVYIAHRL